MSQTSVESSVTLSKPDSRYATNFVFVFALLFNSWLIAELYRRTTLGNWEEPFGFFWGSLYLFITFYIAGCVSAIMARNAVLGRLAIVQFPPAIFFLIETGRL